MKKHGWIALLLAGILSASALAVCASAADTDAVPDAEIAEEESEETAAKKAKKHASEDGISREKKSGSEKSVWEEGDSVRKKKTASGEETERKSKKDTFDDETATMGKLRKKGTAPDGAIGKDAAKEAALEEAGLTAEDVGHIHARYSETAGGYKVRFKTETVKYKITVDVMTGAILESTAEEIPAE